MPSVLIIGRAGSLGGHHGSPQRLFGRTTRRKGRAIDRFFQPLQYLRANTFGRLVGFERLHAINLFSVKGREFRTQPQAAHGDLSDAAPLAVRHFEHLLHNPLRGLVALIADRAYVLILHLGAAFF